MSRFTDVFIHATADVDESVQIGRGTKIWHHAQIMPGATIGKNCKIGKGVYMAGGVRVGNNVKIQNYVSLYKGLIVGDDVLLGPHMTFTNDLYPRAFVDDYTVYETLVKSGSSIGANATIVCGVTLNEYCMIAAGAVVLSDVPPFALVVGNPGRVTGYVCKCGKRLEVEKAPKQEAESKAVVCSTCSQSYELQSGIVPIL